MIAHRFGKLVTLVVPAVGIIAAIGLFCSRTIGNLAAASPADPLALPAKVEYNRDIRPILSENCFTCHGFDKNKREADLRLDTKEGLFAKSDNGAPVAPGKPAESQILSRVTSKDPDEVMPPPATHKKLSPRDVAMLTKWIEQGAEWQGHWAYIKPTRPPVPAADEPGFVHNPVDRFILAKLADSKLKHVEEADRVTLIRRLSFDLTGLPPAQADVDAFVKDQSADAYEKIVDRLLASPAFGERMAMYWLDLVRYADTIGFHSDNPMNVSPYRDYVIQSFNSNKPFDLFTIEQLAGDLLPSPSVEQKVATAYNRLLQTTEEGGAQAKEYEQKYLADRVRTYSTVWLGSTIGCAQCHDHKYDPFTMKDFYSLGAFFADVQEAPIGRREAGMPVPMGAEAEEMIKLDDALADARKRLDAPTPELAAAQAEWERSQGAEVGQIPWKTIAWTKVTAANGTTLKAGEDGIIRASGSVPAKETYTLTGSTDLARITGIRLEVMDDAAFPAKGPGLSENGNFVLTEIKVSANSSTLLSNGRKEKAKAVKLAKASADHSQKDFSIAAAIDGKADTGWAVLPEIGKAREAIFEPVEPIGTPGGTDLAITLEFQSIYPKHQIGKFRLSATTSAAPAGVKSLPANLRKTLQIAADKRTDAQKTELATYYRSIAPALQSIRAEIAAIESKKAELTKTVRTCLVTNSAKPRTVRILPRGNWLDDSGPTVGPAVPQMLATAAVTADGKPAAPTRLDLARWTVSPENPVTSRVFVNRLWKLYFGQGLSKGLDDLGFQGEWPTHPELLDWLAIEFVESKWDVKHMVKLLVTSGAYRQSSKPTPELKEKDPYNRLYARQSRFRLDAEVVRDNALATSGLLVQQRGGKSVFPYQPAGYWFALNFPAREWKNDAGAGLYRRGLYTHWQRSFPHPSLLAFDAPSREESVCERSRSNIPQQALALLNDPTYVEAALVFAERVIKEGGATTEGRIRWAFTQAVNRPPTPEEASVLEAVHRKHAKAYSADAESAAKVLKVGEKPAAKDVNPVELAAWTSVSRVIFNLSEMITRY